MGSPVTSTRLAPVLADAEPATGEFARGSSPDEDSKRIKVPALGAARGLTHVGQDYFDILANSLRPKGSPFI
jgi:hypothetical protein